MNSTELLNEIKKQLELLERKNYDKRSFQSGYLLGYAKALQLQQTGVIKSFYCNSETTLEKRCDKQCSWCNSYEMIMQ
jgi:hypothetical protein